MDKIKKVKLTPAACGLDLGDGSVCRGRIC
mgnify:CR=1 FL=1